MYNYEKLKVWQVSHKLTKVIYRITSKFPINEQYGIVSQLRRASYSVPSNIVEGSYRSSSKEFKRFVEIAFSSSNEVIYFLLLAYELEYIDSNIYEEIKRDAQKVTYMLASLRKTIK